MLFVTGSLPNLLPFLLMCLLNLQILTTEEVSKRRLLERACGDHLQACSARDTQRGELNK